MRHSVFIATVLLTLLSSARAQDQEQKLIDRLLKPDSTLSNNAQNKKFMADGVSVDKRASVSTFYFENKPRAKAFTGTRSYAGTAFDSNSFYLGRNKSAVSTSTAVTRQAPLPSWVISAKRSSDTEKKAPSFEYAGKRPFLDRGKSEKALQRQNPPMTIDQVRELLNKNK